MKRIIVFVIIVSLTGCICQVNTKNANWESLRLKGKVRERICREYVLYNEDGKIVKQVDFSELWKFNKNGMLIEKIRYDSDDDLILNEN